MHDIEDSEQEAWDLTSFVKDNYEGAAPGYKGLGFFHELESINLMDIPALKQLISVEGIHNGQISWRLDFEGLDGSARSIRSGSYKIPIDYRYKMRHELVCQGLSCGSTDQPLKNHFITKMDDADNYTPDFILHGYDTDRHVIELTTSYTDTFGRLREKARLKEFKYDTALRDRTKGVRLLTFDAIVVGDSKVVSTLNLPIHVVSELCLRHRIAKAVEDLAAEELGITMGEDERQGLEDRISQNIRDQIYKIPPATDPVGDLMITPSHIESVLQEPQVEPFRRIVVREILCNKAEMGFVQEHDHRDLIDEYVHKLKSPMTRRDSKPVTNLPLISLPQNPHQSSDVEHMSIATCVDKPILAKIWGKAMDDYQVNPNIMPEDPRGLAALAQETDPRLIEEMTEERSLRKKHYHRVKVGDILTEDEYRELAQQGLWAKKLKDDPIIKDRRQHQQKGFHYDTPTDDVEAWLESETGLERVELVHDKDLLRLIARANELSGNNNTTCELAEDWMSTSLYRSLDVVANIAMECAVSFKQHCPSGTMILKKLRSYDVHLLVSPTCSSEHLFLSVLYKNAWSKNLAPGVCGKPFNVSFGFVTDFVSFKQSKIENLASMPASLLALAGFWAWFYQLEDASVESFRKNTEAMYMLKLSLLIRMEDKNQTEESITLVRYMYMEIFKSGLCLSKPNPFSMLSKMPELVRSRLCLHLIKKIIDGFISMINHPPERVFTEEKPDEEGETTLPNDKWYGLLNVFSNRPIASASKTINLFYLGYLCNKNKAAEGNTDFAILEKTLSEELKLDTTQLERSMGDLPEGEEPKSKQFDKNCIMLGSSILAKRLEAKFGGRWKTNVGEDIIANLTQRMTEDIASLKASCSIPHERSPKKADLTDDVGAGRLKVLEAIHGILQKTGLNPYTNLEAFIRLVESTTRGIVADLFKKQQHGGLREIYVLTIESRILQLYIETMSRTLCSYFEEETLTHPKNKMRTLDSHRVYCANKATKEGRAYTDYCCSSDKTRWNQNLVMPAMCIPLLVLTPKEFHPSIQRVLNLWSSKQVAIPKRVTNLLIKKAELSSDVWNELKEQFWAPSKGSLFDVENGAMVRLKTGMFQGILHYTSSLLHLTFLNATNETIPPILRRQFPELDFKMTQVCSSDDSATILTVFGPKNKTDLDKTDILRMIESTRILYTLGKLCRYFCMKDSVKSTVGLWGYVEFNSEFTLVNTVSLAIIKQVAASVSISESESFLERFHTMYNLLADVYATGLPAYNTSMCQVGQLLLHYHSLGFHINSLFKLYLSKVLEFPDPTLGFFLLDTDRMPGVLGYSYSHWMATQASPIFKRSLKSLLEDPSVVNSDGGVMPTLILKHGDVKRWKSMVERVCSGIDVSVEIKKHPRLLFFKATTLAELRLSLAFKATMPSVSSSMRRGNPFMQALAMSAYAISAHCFSKTTVTEELSKVVRNRSKTSLLREINKRINDSKTAPAASPEQLVVSFPCLERYKIARDVINTFKDAKEVKCPEFRKRRTEIVVQPMSLGLPLSLLESALHEWFGTKVRCSSRVASNCWNSYKQQLPWLKDTFEESLKSSPFETPQELANLVKSQRQKARQFVRVGPGLFTSRFRGQIAQSLRKSYKEGYLLVTSSPVRRVAKNSDLISDVSLALMLPSRRWREDEVKRKLLTHPSLLSDLSNLSSLPSREGKLAVLQAYVKGEPAEYIMRNTIESGLGVFLSYPKLQTKKVVGNKITWEGKGQCMVRFEDVAVLLDLDGHLVVKITTNKWAKLSTRPSLLVHAVRELRVIPARGLLLREGSVADFNGSSFTPPNSSFTPVFENKQLIPSTVSSRDLQLRIKEGSLELLQTSKTHEPTSLIRFNSYPGDVILKMSSSKSKDVKTAWLQQSKLDSVVAAALVIKAAGKDESRKHAPISAEMRKWVQESLNARLSQKGLTSKSLLSKLDEVVYPEPDTSAPIFSPEEIEALIHEALLDDESILDPLVQAFKTEQEEEDGGQVPADLAEAMGCSDDMMWDKILSNSLTDSADDNRPLVMKSYRDFRHLHVFWDDLIDSLTSASPSFWTLLNKGIASPENPLLSESLIILLNKQKRAIRKPMDELATEALSAGTIDFGEDIDEKAITKVSHPEPTPKEPVPSTSGYSWADAVESDEEIATEEERKAHEEKFNDFFYCT